MEIPPSANNQPRLAPPLQQQGGSFPEGNPGRKRNIIIAVAAGAAVVLTAAILALVLLVLPLFSPDRGMSATAGTYFQALIDGDGEKALSVSDPGVPENEKALLQNNVYKSAGQRIDGYRILEARSDFVTAEVTQNGRKQEVILRMTKSREGDWKVGSKNFQKIRVSSARPVKSFTANGVEIPAPDPGAGARNSELLMPAFPGEYTLGLAGDKYSTAEELKTLVSIDRAISKTSASLKVLPSQLLLDETRTLLKNKQSECVATPPSTASEASRRGCSGFALYEYRPTRNMKWTIEKEPTFTLIRSEDSWIIQPKESGKASASYEVNSGSDDAPKWEPKVEQVETRVSGDIQIVDEKATLKER
ncbi:hypothetical protein [Arthrobacter sp. EpRS71]|uniref:hypothetical protein n=1 Tax=Arthrobacter sp. EpRS71 TaxID=1743141 RepID=UPI0007470A8A|nr:hypothetical protein [Arthrobacter sp. EpRS71]KUM35206.1 hypothetical protein AR689_14180 [Arthrobacter sp. EpRS71]